MNEKWMRAVIFFGLGLFLAFTGASPIPGGMAVSGGIKGRVADASNRGIAGVVVTAFTQDFADKGNARTDPQGNYLISNLEPGVYLLHFSPAAGSRWAESWYQDQGSAEKATPVTVESGKTAAGIDARLGEFGTILGRVLNPEGKAIPGFEVLLYGEGDIELNRTICDENGVFQFPYLAEGAYRLFFPAPSGERYLPQWYPPQVDIESEAISLQGGTVDIGDVKLEMSGSLSGRVSNTQGEPIPMLDVEVLGRSGETVATAMTDEKGGYLVPEVRAGSYRLHFPPDDKNKYQERWFHDKSSFEESDWVVVSQGQDLTGLDETLLRWASVEGRVTDDRGAGAAAVSVELWNLQDKLVASARTDEDGHFSIYPAAPGKYRVFFEARQTRNLFSSWHGGHASPEKSTIFSITENQVLQDINGSLKSGGGVEGHVTDEKGQPVKGLDVYVTRRDGPGGWSTRTDAEGLYGVYRLETGKYTVAFSPTPDQVYLPQSYREKNRNEIPDPVLVAEGKVSTGIDCQLQTGGSIRGTVRDSSGQGVPKILIEIPLPEEYTSRAVFSDAQGNYRIGGLREGSYRVKFDASRIDSTPYVSEWYRGRLIVDRQMRWLGGRGREAEGDPVQVMLGQETAGVDAQLRRFGSLGGRLTDRSGKGLYGVYVSAHSTENVEIKMSSTDKGGAFTLDRLPPGVYKIHFHSEREGVFISTWFKNGATFAAADLVALEDGQSQNGIDLQLASGGTISGKVTDPWWRALPGIFVQLYDLSNRKVLDVETGKDGRYRLQGVPSGKYKVLFRDARKGTYLPLWYPRADSFVSAMGITLGDGGGLSLSNVQMPYAGGIAGRVTDADGAPVAGYQVQIFDSEGDTVLVNTTTDDQGNFRLGPLAGGTYRVKFIYYPLGKYPAQWYSGRASPEAADRVVVKDGQVKSGIDLKLPKWGEVSGRVTGPDGKGVEGVRIGLFNSDGSEVFWTQSDAKGDYRIQQVSAGTYAVHFNAESTGSYLSQWYPAAEARASAQTVQVGPGGERIGLDARLVQGGAITGLVAGTDGQPIPSVAVEVYLGGKDQQVASVTADGYGYFRIGKLPAGQYRLRANPGRGKRYLPQWYASQASGQPQLVRVTAGATAGLNPFALKTGGSIRGQVTGSDGAPLVDFEVYVYDLDGREQGSAKTDDRGRYEVVPLASGKYRVLFHTNYRDNVISEYFSRKALSAEADALAVNEGMWTDGVDAQLSSGGVISGLIRGRDGNGLDGVGVVVVDEAGARVAGARTDSLGRFAVPTLEPGIYKLQLEPPTSLYLSQWYKAADRFESGQILEVKKSGGDVKIEVSLAPAGSIRGLVVDADNMPVAKIRVEARRANGEVMALADTDLEGNFTLAPLRPGAYTLIANPEAKGAFKEGWYTAGASPKPSLVAVKKGKEVSRIVIRLARKSK